MAAGAVVALLVGGALGYFAPHPQSQAQVPAEFQKVLDTYNAIDSSYYKKVSEKKLAQGAISGMVDSLDDPYSVYLQNNDASSLNTQISGSFGGIGATMRQSSDGVYVDTTNAGSAAQKAGIKAGDKIVSVDGKSMAKKDINAVVSQVRGKIGTKVQVGISRGGKQQTFTMTRAKVTVPSMSGTIDKAHKQIGIITFTTFTDSSAKEMKQVVKKLRKQGAKKFILDLRGNPGGVLDQAMKIDSMFLKNGKTIVQVKQRGQKAEVYKAGKKYDDGFKIKEPTVVLIDGNSASASEITAAALNQSAGIPLIGTKSFGKGTVQTIAGMNNKSELKLTIAKWLTPNGTWINHKGIQPTIKADYPKYAYLQAIGADSLNAGATGKDVKTLQSMLTAVGQKTAVSGTYDDATTAAVKAFQSAHHLSATGKADANTIVAIEAALTAKIAQNDNAMKAAVKKLQ